MATPLELHGTPIPGHPVRRHPGDVDHPPPKAKPASTPRIPSKAVTRQAQAAAQAAAATPPATPKAFQPWASVIQHAEQRMRGRLALALAELEHHMAMAGQVLDVAEQAAKEAETQILEAAWKRWHQDLDAAADVAAAVLGPARKAYAELVAAAGAGYDTAIAEARLAYEAELSRAESARALAASMPESTAARAAG